MTYIVGNPTMGCIYPLECNGRKNRQLVMNATEKKKEYDAKLDSKKRLTIRGARTEYYHVTEFEDGSVKLSPRELIHPDEVSKRTLEMMDKAMKNLEEGKVSEPVDMEELERLLEE
ncbi:hypothetical protein [Halalkalibaculum sp. DA3122]|uniref:hypothetical protein n=1 Tax=Halalkalibaculum sp. DA3122 TaxID=3373607 RepID=UPI0037540EF9